MSRLILASLNRFAREEDGTSTIEFLFVFPIIFTTFIAAFESGFYTLRFVMLDRGLDMTVRELRLGIIAAPAMAKIKQSICSKGQLFGDCENALTLDLTPVDTASWVFPSGSTECRDRGLPPKPVVEPNLGVENQIMLIRVCVASNPLFPTAAVAANMVQSSVGDYFVTAVSAFVNEP
jgi:hypothetical protein